MTGTSNIGSGRCFSDHICKPLLHIPKLFNPSDRQQRNHYHGKTQAHWVDEGASADDRPAKPLNHAHHRVQGIKKLPLCWHDRA